MGGAFIVTAGSLLLGLAAISAPISGAHAQGDKLYTVECPEGATKAEECQVDKAVYVGWRTYHANCHVCHAQDAVGSTFAPSLVDRLKDIDHERYLHSVNEGYTGQIGVMPAWKDNPNVNKRFEELYAYLMARADGVLPPGRPDRLPN
jgi:mono/diheme cytochrome c family protein